MTPDPLALEITDRGEHALARLAAMRAQDPPTTGGRVLSYVYDSGLAELDELATRAARLAHGVNGLDPTVYSSVARIHGGIVDRVRDILRGRSAGAGGEGGDGLGGDIYGNVTSGGTESCMLACLAAREVSGRQPGDGGTIVAPVTVHAAFRKAAHLLGVGAHPRSKLLWREQEGEPQLLDIIGHEGSRRADAAPIIFLLRSLAPIKG